MSMSDWMMVVAVLMAPFLAVHVQKRLELLREKRQRKMNVFLALMGTRAARVSPSHVQALNMIDTEFYGRKILWFTYRSRSEKAIVESWKLYRDHLNNSAPSDDKEPAGWLQRADDLFTDLLYMMAQSLGYDFDKVHVKRGAYSPVAHGDVEREQRAISKNLADILSGTKPIPMQLVSFPGSEEALDKQKELQQRIVEYLDGKRVLKVKLEGEEKE